MSSCSFSFISITTYSPPAFPHSFYSLVRCWRAEEWAWPVILYSFRFPIPFWQTSPSFGQLYSSSTGTARGSSRCSSGRRWWVPSFPVSSAATRQLFCYLPHSLTLYHENGSPATAPPLSRSVKIAQNKLPLWSLVVREGHFGLFLVWTDVSEQHVPVALFQLVSRVPHVETQIVAILHVWFPVLYP